jgi:iron complex transport system substrate-binding protein
VPTRRWLVALVSIGLVPICASPLLANAEASHAPRVISLAPSVTEILFALGAGDEVVGVSTYCDYPPEVTAIKRVGTFLTPNVEEIVALQPDVIIGVPTPGNEGPVRSLRSLGLNVVIVGGDTMRQMRDSIDVIARAIGRPTAGRDLLERLDARLAAIQERVHDVPPRRVLMVVGEKPLVAVGTGTFPDELIRMAGGINVAGGTGLTWPHVNIEAVIAWAPEVIIDTSMGTEEKARTLDFWKQFPSLPAVRDHRVYGFRSYQLLRPGPRIVDALDTLARTIHPERFHTTVQSPRSKVWLAGTHFRIFWPWTLDLGVWTLDAFGCRT